MNDTGSNANTGTVAIGSSSLSTQTSGMQNTAVGYESLAVLTTGKRNTAFGWQTLHANMNTGDNNTAVGYSSLYTYNPAADDEGDNTALGAFSGYYVTTGEDNTLIGYSAGATGSQNLTTGDGNTVVGHNAIVSAAGASNQTVIGQGADGQADNSVTLGNDAVTAVYMASDSGALVHTAGIQFPATQVANGGANVLDDYEEGNGTPTVSMSTSGTVTLGSSPTYCYTKVGNIIHFSFEFSTTGVSSPVGTLQVALPIASAASFYSAGSLRVYSETFDGSPFISIAPSASVCQLLTSKTGAGTQSITPTAGTRYYFGTVTYRA